jgi:hypothetical protein
MKDIFLWVILPLILAEALLVGPWISERLLRWGTRWLPEEYRERYITDWLGELDVVPGSLFKLGFAIRVLLSVPATHRALTGRDALWVVIAKRLLALAVTGLLMAAMVLVRLRNQMRSNPERAEAFTSSVERALRRPAPVDVQMQDPIRTYRPVLPPEVTLGAVRGILVRPKLDGDPIQPAVSGVFSWHYAPPELLGIEVEETPYEALPRNPEEDWPDLRQP